MPSGQLDRFEDIRKSFHGVETGPYLDVAARGLLFEGGRAALMAHLDDAARGTTDKAALFASVEETRRLFAALIRASPDEIAFTRNVTDGIAAFGAAIDWKAGDGVLLCETLEHPANIYPWFALARRFGLAIKTIAPVDGALAVDRIVDAIEPSTRVIAVSSVSFAPGFRFAVAQLGAECRRRGILLLVDAAQSIGVIETDVDGWQADAIAVSTQKGLLSTYGLGMLYVRREVAEALTPMYISRFGVDVEGHEASRGDPAAFKCAPGARRFDLGNYNYPAILAVQQALGLLLDVGPAAIEARVVGLASSFADRMLDLGLPVFGGRPGMHSSHIVTIGSDLGEDHDATGDAALVSLYQHLVAGGVRLTIRRNLLRFSFHLYNDETDIARVGGLVEQWRRSLSS